MRAAGQPRRRPLSRRRGGALLIGLGAFLCVAAVPTASLAATVATPTPLPTAARLTLTQTANRATVVVGDTVTFTITVGNSGSLPAAAVTVDETLSGDAGFLVEDGTSSTPDTFVGSPVTTITRVVTGHYRWTYPAVSTGDSDVVKFSAVLRAPGAAAGGPPRVISLTSTASTAGVAPAVATVTAPFTPPPGGVKGTSTGVPSTGSTVELAAAGFLLLGGLGLILLGMLARKPGEMPVTAFGRPRGRSR